MSEAKAVLEIYFNNPVGIGEHPQIVEEIDKQLYEKYKLNNEEAKIIEEIIKPM